MAASVETNMTTPVKTLGTTPTPKSSTPKAGNLTPLRTPAPATHSKNNNTSNNSSSSPAQIRPQPTTEQRQVSHNTHRIRNKHEEFKNQLVHDVFERDNKGRVPMEKVAMLIWQFRDDPAVVQFMAQFVAKVCFLFFFTKKTWSCIAVGPPLCFCIKTLTLFSPVAFYFDTVLGLPTHLRRDRILPPPNRSHDHPP